MKSKTVESAFKRAQVEQAEAQRRVNIRKPDAVSEFVTGGWCVVLGRSNVGTDDFCYFAQNSLDGETNATYNATFFDTYADAMEVCAVIMRDSLGERFGLEFPAPEFPRVAFVNISASIWLCANS